MQFKIQHDTFNHDKLHQLAGNRLLLSFSCGKDSLATWLILRDRGFDVVPFYLELVPGLEFVEHSLRYYERFFGCRIHRVLHPNFYRSLNNLHWQPSHRIGVIDALELPLYDYDDVTDGMRRTIGHETAWCAIGTRKCESLMRAKRMKADGLNPKRRTCTPVMDWREPDVYDCLAHFGCPLPIDYQLFGRSFDGVYARYLVPIKERFPRDFERIVEYYPLVGVEFARLAIGERHAFAKAEVRPGGPPRRQKVRRGVERAAGVG